MSFAPKELADGLLSDSLTTIFTASAAVGTYVKALTLFNTDTNPQTIMLFLNLSGTDRAWKRFVLEPDEFADAISGAESIILETGGLIRAVATDPNVVSYTIMGVEET